MSIIKYDDKYLTTHGLPNIQNTCYLNSILQCLFSCSSFVEKVNLICSGIKYLDKNDKCSYFAYLLKNIHDGVNSTSYIPDIYSELYTTLLNHSKITTNNVKLSLGQQDAHEGLLCILDILNIPSVNELFEHRHISQILCHVCKYVSSKDETNNIFEVQPEDFNSLYKYKTNLDDFICARCKDRKRKLKEVSLVMVPEILPILIKKYNEKILTSFPRILQFPSSNKNKIHYYKLVAQCEHLGTKNGGHYVAICLRENNTWYMMDDLRFSRIEQSPTVNTYMCFYHYIDTK